jgi:hypothetical protein
MGLQGDFGVIQLARDPKYFLRDPVSLVKLSSGKAEEP